VARRRHHPAAVSSVGQLARLGPGALPDDELLGILLGSREAGRAALALGEPDGLAMLARADLADLLPLGRRRAAAVVAALELGRRAATAWPAHGWHVRSPADLADRLMPAMGSLPREELRSVLLNTKNAVTAIITVYAGNLAGSPVRVGEVFRDAVRRGAAALVVVHNHPSGDPAPSAEDLRITRELAEAGRLLDIELMDHLVIGHGRWVSLRALGAL
jgi:DNA repair protein RadC